MWKSRRRQLPSSVARRVAASTASMNALRVPARPRALGTPAAMESTRPTSSSLHAAGTSAGLTAMSAPAAGTGSVPTVMPGNRFFRSRRRAATGSTTASWSASAHRASTSPRSSASPIFPPPTITSSTARNLWQAAARVAGRSAVAGLEVHVRAGGVAGLADVADQLALVDGLAVGRGEPAHVGVQRAHPAAVVDDDGVAVAALLTDEDHRAGLRRPDGGADVVGDVDARVEPAPAHAVLGGDAAVRRPDAAAAAGAGVGAGRRARPLQDDLRQLGVRLRLGV